MLLSLKTTQLIRTGIAATVLALGLAACVSTDRFVEPIERFSMATDAATTALKAIDESTTERLTAMAIAEATQNPGRLKGEDCKTTGTRCLLVVSLADTTTKIQLNATSMLPNSTRAMSSIQSYGRALADIAAADETAEVRAGIEKSADAVTSIASVFGLSLGAALNPLKELAVAGFQQYQNSIKLDALQRATKAADPFIKETMARLAVEARFARTGNLARLESDYNKASASVVRDATESNIKTLIDAASKLDAALIVNQANVFTKVAEAHAGLTKDLTDPNASFADVLASLDVVLTEVGHIQDFANAVTADNR